jgi:hypothetical protein
MEDAFRNSFLNALKKAILLLNQEELQKKILTTMADGLGEKGIDVKALAGKIDQVAPYCVGSLVAEISMRAVMEDTVNADGALSKKVSDVFLNAIGDDAFDVLIENCNFERAKKQFGEEKVEQIAEELSTGDIYETEEFAQAVESLSKSLHSLTKKWKAQMGRGKLT